MMRHPLHGAHEAIEAGGCAPPIIADPYRYRAHLLAILRAYHGGTGDELNRLIEQASHEFEGEV